ncbi:hypothetical protein [Cyanobium sp. PCC 7001]|uniref:hypothetical protein n=1 Tax=Cyanobium sp. PCC 7001 TaxID=180281 RepID=UPI00030D1809|nr:hypothetical protein [Cyanobium sp. PCC 7001]
MTSDQVRLELIGNGHSARVPFQVIGPTTEVAFLEELIEEYFGGMTVPPRDLFAFLQQDPWVQEFFGAPELVEGNLDGHQVADATFTNQNLGNKLVQAGVIELDELEELLEQYRPFAETQRFGEFLRLNLSVPPQMIDLLLNPSLFDASGFNDKRLGERLLDMGAVSEAQLEEALAAQRTGGGRLGEILAAKGYISPGMARFFSQAKVNARGEIDYAIS